VLRGQPDDRPLPVVVYLDDIAVFGDDQDQVLEDTLETIRRLTLAGFMINLTKSQFLGALRREVRSLSYRSAREAGRHE
jgi:hypothetical protein